MKQNIIIAVVGDAEIKEENEYQIAFDIGKLIVDSGYVLATGGLNGVMEAAAKGASSSSKYDGKSIIAVLPDYSENSANIYSDLTLPLGNGVARNINLISISNAVIAIGGGAGTLSEISTAWQMKKLIVALGNFGWSGRLGGSQLDSRRNDIIFSASYAQEAIDIINDKISDYPKNFKGINTNFSCDYALNLIKENFDLPCLKIIGKGKSGVVIGNSEKTFKIFYDTSFEFYSYIYSLSESFSKIGIPFSVQQLSGHTILQTSITGKNIREVDKFISLDKFREAINQYFYAGYVSTDIKAENFILTNRGELVLFDIDKDVIPYTQLYFESQCRQIFAVYKLQNFLRKNPKLKFKNLIGRLKTEADFSALEKVLDEVDLAKEYRHFRKALGENFLYKNMIYSYLDKNSECCALFDYGAGTLEIASNLNSKGFEVTAYDIDKNAFKEEYAQGIDFFSDTKKLDYHLKNKKYDIVLCSLVLCCVDDETAKMIVENCKTLAESKIVFVICNPFFTKTQSLIQEKEFTDSYSTHSKYNKIMRLTKNRRTEFHRNLGFYENLFLESGNFEIEEVLQSKDTDFGRPYVGNSDFMLISLRKREN